MKANLFKKLLKTDNPKHIIYLHCNLKINLTSKQLENVIELKNKKRRRNNEINNSN